MVVRRLNSRPVHALVFHSYTYSWLMPILWTNKFQCSWEVWGQRLYSRMSDNNKDFLFTLLLTSSVLGESSSGAGHLEIVLPKNFLDYCSSSFFINQSQPKASSEILISCHWFKPDSDLWVSPCIYSWINRRAVTSRTYDESINLTTVQNS